MERRIREILAGIEREERVKILYACESGSRAWGFSSPDSDYDVRFIFVRPLDDYLTLLPKRDVIEKMYKEEDIDLAGWDLRKAMNLFAKSNPSFYEWLNSPVVYLEDAEFIGKVRSMMDECFIPKASFHHYLGTAVSHDLRYLERKGIVLKRFLYYFRSLLCCRWVAERRTSPPVRFETLFGEMIGEQELLDAVNRMLEKKREGKEHDSSTVEDCLIDYGEGLRDQMETIESMATILDSDKEAPVQKLEALFRETVLRFSEEGTCKSCSNWENRKARHTFAPGKKKRLP